MLTPQMDYMPQIFKERGLVMQEKLIQDGLRLQNGH